MRKARVIYGPDLQALKRLPDGAELPDADAIPYYYLGEDGVYRECYDYFAPTGFVVCEYI